MTIDAFGLAPEWTSCIAGLGGDEACPDLAYVFHTPYMHFEEREVVFSLTFTNLVVTSGVLVLRVNAYPDQRGAVAYQVVLDEVLLRGIMGDEGRARIRFLPRPATRYALLGHIYTGTDARADALDVVARYTSEVDAEAERKTAARRTLFSDPGVRPVAKLRASHPASLRDPVSQICTDPQFGEPAFAEWTGRMGMAPAADRGQWEAVFILQALRRYGVLQAGAQGLAFGGAGEPLAAVIAASGCRLVVARRPGPDEEPESAAASVRESLRRPVICDDGLFDQRVAVRMIANGDLPAELAGFDFLWSRGGHAAAGSLAAALEFITAAIQCLKPGGVAVFTGDMWLPAEDAAGLAAAGAALRRKDWERLTLILIGGGHEVAQLNFEGEPATSQGEPATSFGLIVRRGLRDR